MSRSARTRAAAVFLCTLAACAAGTTMGRASGRTSSRAAIRWICPAWFAPLPRGWVEGNLGAHPTTTTTDAWAHSSGFANLTDIPRHGIYVSVLLGVHDPSSPAPTSRQPLDLPLDIRHPDQIATAEGPLAEYRFAGRYHGLYVDVRVDFGRRNLSPAMRRRAQPILTALQLPRGMTDAPNTCR